MKTESRTPSKQKPAPKKAPQDAKTRDELSVEDLKMVNGGAVDIFRR